MNFATLIVNFGNIDQYFRNFSLSPQKNVHLIIRNPSDNSYSRRSCSLQSRLKSAVHGGDLVDFDANMDLLSFFVCSSLCRVWPGKKTCAENPPPSL